MGVKEGDMAWRGNFSPFPVKDVGFFIPESFPGGKIILLLLLLLPLIIAGCASVPVIKMPTPLPDIVKEYKSFKLDGSKTDWIDSEIRVAGGDYLTIMAKGEIFTDSGIYARRYGPTWKVAFQIGIDGKIHLYGYKGKAHNYRVSENGNIFLRLTKDLGGYLGFFTVATIVWKKEDPIQISNFFEQLRLKDPHNETLRQIAQEFKTQKEIILAEQNAKKEVEETKKAIADLQGKEIKGMVGFGGLSKPSEEKLEKEKQIAELNERLQKALRALKDLEEMKKKLAEQQEKEKVLMARLEQAEQDKLKLERSASARTPPLIAIASPLDGTSVDFEYIPIAGVAESERGIVRFEILVNQQAASRKEERDLKLVTKDLRRVDFSERIRLREGKNEITVAARDAEGVSAKKTISIQLAKKRMEIWAVVIGISKYKNIPSLKYAANDAREFYRYLTEVNRVPKDHIWLLLDEEASLDNLKSVLGTQLRRQTGKDDMVIIYLAGHGATERDAASPDGDGLEKYILPHNVNPKDLYASAMPMREVAHIFNRINSDRLVFISDTCYSGASGGRTIPVVGTRTNISGAFLDRLSHGKGRVILTASDANEVSMEKDELEHGVFTYYLLEALRGQGDIDKDGVITIDEVYRYVSMKVPQATGQDQHPVKKGEMTGQIVLGVVK